MDRIALNEPIDVAPVTVTTTPARILTLDDLEGMPPVQGVFLQSDGVVYLGGPEVTASSGLCLEAKHIIFLDWFEGFQWYAVSADSVTVRVVPVA